MGRLARLVVGFSAVAAGCGGKVVDLRDASPAVDSGAATVGDADTSTFEAGSATDPLDAGDAPDDAVGASDAVEDSLGSDDATTFDGAGDAPGADTSSLADYDGTWSGTTSQGETLTFIVNGGIVDWRYGWILAMCASATRITFTVPVPVAAGGAFMRVVTAGPGGMSTTFAGQFSLPNACQGTIDFQLKAIPTVPSCSGAAQVTFTASRL